MKTTDQIINEVYTEIIGGAMAEAEAKRAATVKVSVIIMHADTRDTRFEPRPDIYFGDLSQYEMVGCLRLELDAAELEKHGLQLVAEMAYTGSQHFFGTWTDAPTFQFTDGVERARSSSVGDAFLIFPDGSRAAGGFMVDRFGFIDLNEYRASRKQEVSR